MAGRRWVAALVGLGLALTAPVAVATEPTHAKPKGTRVALAVSADEVDYADAVTLSGKLLSGSAGLKGQKLVLKHKPGGARTWDKVGTVTTARGGSWQKTLEVRSRGAFVAVYKGTRAYAPSKSDKRQVDVFAPLTDPEVSPNGRDAYKDEDWTWTASTAPELEGQSVSLDRGPIRLPVTVETGTIGPGGAIELTHRMAEAGNWEYRVSVESSALMYGATSAPTTVRTRNQPAPTTPTITTSSLPSVEVHVPYQVDLVGTGGELTWSAVDSTLPPGLWVTPTGELTGAATTTGTWELTVRATNGVGQASRTLTFTSEPGTLDVGTWPFDDAAVGQAYPTGSWSSGGFQELYCTPCEETGMATEWSITAGTLPHGLELAYDYVVDSDYIFGTPTQAGVYGFTVTGVSEGHSGSKEYTIRVLPSVDDLLLIDFHPFYMNVPDGTVGEPYSHQMTAGGATGLTWSALSTLPPGLTLSSSGLLSGTPAMSGYGWIAFAVTDGTRYDWQALQFQASEAP